MERRFFKAPPPLPPLLHWLGNNNTSYIVFLQKKIADNVTAPQKPQYGNPFRHVDYVTCQSVFRLIGLFRDSRYDGVKINAFPPLSMMWRAVGLFTVIISWCRWCNFAISCAANFSDGRALEMRSRSST